MAIMSSTSSDDDLEQQSGSPSGNKRTLDSHSRGEEVEGARGALELQADAVRAASAAETIGAVVFPSSNSVAGTQAESERGQTSSVPEENGQQVVGNWIVPTVIGVLSCLIQVVEGSQKANSDQKILLYLCSSMSLGTASLGIMLFIMQWINSPRRNFIIRLMSAVALGFSFVDICFLIIFLFIVEQSKAHK